MRWLGAYLVHLCISALAVPPLTLILTSVGFGMAHRMFGIGGSAQQFYSDHVLFIEVIVGLCLGFEVCRTFTLKGAVWVWLPFTLIFAVRLVLWQTSGSVLFHSSTLNHFFTADCQIARYADPDFGSRCGDKLFIAPLWVGALAYSGGAVIHKMLALRASRLVVAGRA